MRNLYRLVGFWRSQAGPYTSSNTLNTGVEERLMNMWKHIVIQRKRVILYSAKCFLDWLGSIHWKWTCQRKDKPRYLCVDIFLLFIFGCAGSPLLCMDSIRSCERYSLAVVHGLLIVGASLVSGHRL